MANRLTDVLKINGFFGKHYAEPYAGGAGLALVLLMRNQVEHIHINDLDFSIWSFWHAVLNETEDLIQLIMETPITIEEWHAQREVLSRQDHHHPLFLGFSAFFLNRTNRSGIIKKAGPIGGLSQKGTVQNRLSFQQGCINRKN